MSTQEQNGTESMADNKDVETLHQRIDKLTDRFEICNGDIMNKLNAIQNIVDVIKNTCKSRGETCAKHVVELDRTVRGNGKEGLVTRITSLEQRSTGKEKFAYFIIGVLGTAAVSVIIAFVSHLLSS